MTNGADTNCRTAEQVMNGQRLVSGQGMVRPTAAGAHPGAATVERARRAQKGWQKMKKKEQEKIIRRLQAEVQSAYGTIDGLRGAVEKAEWFNRKPLVFIHQKRERKTRGLQDFKDVGQYGFGLIPLLNEIGYARGVRYILKAGKK